MTDTRTLEGTIPVDTMSPAFSIVIEWQNVLLAESERAVRMLREVTSQTAEARKSAEVLLAYDTEAEGVEEMDEILAASGILEAPGITVRREGAPGLRYYELKNLGAERSRAPIVICLDSDVIPAPGWLTGILEPFESGEADVVSGNTYVGPVDSLFSRTMALTWMFPLATVDDPPERTRRPRFYANNVAFTRETIAKHPWPPGGIKEQNERLWDALEAAEVRAWRASRAKCEHPVPTGFVHFVRYAFSRGYDRAFKRLGPAPRRWVWLLALPAAFLLDLGRAVVRLVPSSRRRAVGMSTSELPTALGIAAGYAALTSVGFAITMVAPRLIPRRFST